MARSASPESFFDAAMRLLAGPGLPALRIGRLCREVGVTSGSFYHHFGNWDGFVAALLDHWATEEVDRLLDLVRREQDPLERVELLKGLALTVPHDAETAIRRWAGTDEVVAAAQQRVDDRRRDAVREVLAPVIGAAAPWLRAGRPGRGWRWWVAVVASARRWCRPRWRWTFG